MGSATPITPVPGKASNLLRTWELRGYALYSEWPKVADAMIEAPKRPRIWRAARALLSWCYTTLGGASSPDKISNNVNNINGLKFYY